MFAKLDAVVVALSVLSGSMWIESSHRLDTGAPDDSLVATPASECRDDPVADRNAINRGFAIEGIAQDTAQTDDDAANVAPACPTD